MPILSALLALSVVSADSLELMKTRWETPQLRAEVDSAPPAVPACPRDHYPLTGWTRRSAGIEGISYATPEGYPRSRPYVGGSTLVQFASGRTARDYRLAVNWSRTQEMPSWGERVEARPTKHDYSWCRESVDGREMLIVSQKFTRLEQNAPGGVERTYVVWAVWPVRAGVWLAFQGEATSPAAQREILAVIRTFRVERDAPSRQIQFRPGYRLSEAMRAVSRTWD